MAVEDSFNLPEEQKIVTEEEKLAAAKKGADIHCPYCGTRNPAGTEICAHCGGNLKEGTARPSGQVLGAHSTQAAPEINCPYCSARVKASTERCPSCGGDLNRPTTASGQPAVQPKKMPIWVIIAGILFLVVCIGAFAAFAIRGSQTESVAARVQDVYWERSIEILEERPVQYSSWEDSLPADAEGVICEDRYRFTSNYAVPQSTEVCGTPYIVDEGSGVGEVVQDCEYHVYDRYCEFTALEWQVVSQPITRGNDMQPLWPEVYLATNQREGSHFESYSVVFETNQGTFEYPLSESELFYTFTPGSEWNLTINGFGEITAINP